MTTPPFDVGHHKTKITAWCKICESWAHATCWSFMRMCRGHAEQHLYNFVGYICILFWLKFWWMVWIIYTTSKHRGGTIKARANERLPYLDDDRETTYKISVLRCFYNKKYPSIGERDLRLMVDKTIPDSERCLDSFYPHSSQVSKYHIKV